MPFPHPRPLGRIGLLLLISVCEPSFSLNPLNVVRSRHTSSLDPERYMSLDLTHVEFDSTDPLAQILGLITLSPIFLLCAYVTLVLHRRELLFLNALIGQLACEWLNGRLKGIFKQDRPTDRFGEGYGMPSSHSQFVGYFAAFFLSHFVSFWPSRKRWVRSKVTANLVRTDKVTPIYLIRTLEHAGACAAIVVVAALTAYSRYHLMYHSSAQIVVGLSIGTAFGLVYYHVTERLSRRSLFAGSTSVRRIILDHPISIALRVRDSYSVYSDGGIEAEYGAWREGWTARGQKDGDDAATRRQRMYRALALAERCEPTDTAFCVGCVICPSPGQEGDVSLLLKAARRELGTSSLDESLGLLVTGFSRELPGNTHAEESALMKLLELEQRQKASGLLTRGRSTTLQLDLYTTMEPCSERLSKKAACVENILNFNGAKHRIWVGREAPATNGTVRRRRSSDDGVIVELRIARILQGVKEPDDFVKCQGTRVLRSEGGLDVLTVSDEDDAIEYEALRLAKKGHADQPKSKGFEGVWKAYRD